MCAVVEFVAVDCPAHPVLDFLEECVLLGRAVSSSRINGMGTEIPGMAYQRGRRTKRA